MTEDEAKTKICPLSMPAIGDGIGGITSCPTYCVGSQCMAWRWSRLNLLRVTSPSGGVYILEEKDMNRMMMGESAVNLPDEGYCGLVAKP